MGPFEKAVINVALMNGFQTNRGGKEERANGVLRAAYVREGSYNTLLPATSSEEEEEGEDQSSEDSLRKSAKQQQQRAKRGRGAFKDDQVRN